MDIQGLYSAKSHLQAPMTGMSQWSKPQASQDFSQMLKNSIGEVDKLMKEADEASKSVASGKSQNLHESMIAMEKADTAFKLMVQVRNKALEAYNDILRMQV